MKFGKYTYIYEKFYDNIMGKKKKKKRIYNYHLKIDYINSVI